MNPKTEPALRRCSECGGTFTPSSNRQRYCPDCSHDVRRRQVRASVDTHRNKPKIFLPGSSKQFGQTKGECGHD